MMCLEVLTHSSITSKTHRGMNRNYCFITYVFVENRWPAFSVYLLYVDSIILLAFTHSFYQ